MVKVSAATSSSSSPASTVPARAMDPLKPSTAASRTSASPAATAPTIARNSSYRQKLETLDSDSAYILNREVAKLLDIAG